jgi:uncharacterized phage protein gp47/JayE
VQLPFTTAAADLADLATAFIQAQWPGWIPNDADLEVIQIEALSLLAADNAQQASNMPLAALIAFGTKLLGQPYGTGAPATTTVTFTMANNAGYTVPAGSQVEIDSFAFQTTADLVVPAGQTTGNAVVSSTIPTAQANNLGAAIAPISVPAWVVALAVTGGLTSGGADPQSDQDYANQISRDRLLTSKALVTLIDYEFMALDQPGIGRAKAEYGTSVRNITVYITDTNGQPCSTTVENDLLAIYQNPAIRCVNAIPTVTQPTYTTINVAYGIVSNVGTDPTNLVTMCNAAIAEELSPLGWGVPSSNDPQAQVTTWLNETVVHINRLVTVIGRISGVNYVSSLTLNGGTTDITMTGPVALPELGTISGSVTGTVD